MASTSERVWKWCLCNRTALCQAKCAECDKSLGNLRDVPMEYAGKQRKLVKKLVAALIAGGPTLGAAMHYLLKWLHQ